MSLRDKLTIYQALFHHMGTFNLYYWNNDVELSKQTNETITELKKGFLLIICGTVTFADINSYVKALK